MIYLVPVQIQGHGDPILTYAHSEPLSAGTRVVVPLRSGEAKGTVVSERVSIPAHVAIRNVLEVLPEARRFVVVRKSDGYVIRVPNGRWSAAKTGIRNVTTGHYYSMLFYGITEIDA